MRHFVQTLIGTEVSEARAIVKVRLKKATVEVFELKAQYSNVKNDTILVRASNRCMNEYPGR